jgi:hypothetical protein
VRSKTIVVGDFCLLLRVIDPETAGAAVSRSSGYASMMPRLRAIATAWVRPLAPNFDEILFI